MKMRAHLPSTTLPPQFIVVPVPDSRTADRIMVSRAYLGRDPFVLFYPGTHHAFWVEGEPDDWRAFLEQADQEVGGLDSTVARFKRSAGGLN